MPRAPADVLRDLCEMHDISNGGVIPLWTATHDGYNKMAALLAEADAALKAEEAKHFIVAPDEPVLLIGYDGSIKWRGREVTTDDELRAAMRDLAAALKKDTVDHFFDNAVRHPDYKGKSAKPVGDGITNDTEALQRKPAQEPDMGFGYGATPDMFVKVQKGAARQVYEAIKHGDEEHRAWLLEALECFFMDKPLPPPRAAPPAPAVQWTAEQLAREFHDLYETAAADFGYVTRPETRVFDPESQNGRLMVAVCYNILRRLASAPPAPSPDPFADKYHELLLAVEKKFPNESRHKTALRYIREREQSALGPAKSSLPPPPQEEPE